MCRPLGPRDPQRPSPHVRSRTDCLYTGSAAIQCRQRRRRKLPLQFGALGIVEPRPADSIARSAGQSPRSSRINKRLRSASGDRPAGHRPAVRGRAGAHDRAAPTLAPESFVKVEKAAQSTTQRLGEPRVLSRLHLTRSRTLAIARVHFPLRFSYPCGTVLGRSRYFARYERGMRQPRHAARRAPQAAYAPRST